MNGKLSATVAVIRSYNNKHVTTQVKNLLTAGIGRVIVVTNGPADKGATPGYLGTLVNDVRVQIIEMTEGYSWANALNVALKAIQMANVSRRISWYPEFRFILNVSVEAQFTRAHLEAMLDAATDDRMIGVVGTSFEGRLDGNLVDLGRSYRHPRNTGMVIRLEAFGAMLGGFDARCDGMGGMEDIAFVLEMLALSNLQYKMTDLQVPLILGQHHHQPTKEEREQGAMDKILAFWRNLFPQNSPERERIDSAIATMGLDR